MTETSASVQRAAEALVSAFGSHDRVAYFASFTPDATFLFHSTPGLLASRDEYEALWSSWEEEGFRVESCRSFDRHYRPVSDGVVVFTHRVRTRLAHVDGTLCERETIVFVRETDGRWLAVHEHLSRDPQEER